MKYKKIKPVGIIKGYDKIVTRDHNNGLTYSLRSSKDFSILQSKNIGDRKYAIHYLEKKVVLTDLREHHLVINPMKNEFSKYTGSRYKISESLLMELFYNPKEHKYQILNSNILHNSFQKRPNIEYKILDFACLEYKLDHPNAYIRMFNLIDGLEKWKVNLKENIVRLDYSFGFIVLDSESKTGSTIVLNQKDGKVRWRCEKSYTSINKRRGIVQFGGDCLSEIDLSSGKYLFKTNPIGSNNCVYFPYFNNQKAVYYLTDDHSFGMIKKDTGSILWEFDLIDPQGAKRKLSDWLLLGNGNLVLQAMPNHPNGDLTCIFNPEENMAFSKINEGERIS